MLCYREGLFVLAPCCGYRCERVAFCCSFLGGMEFHTGISFYVVSFLGSSVRAYTVWWFGEDATTCIVS